MNRALENRLVKLERANHASQYRNLTDEQLDAMILGHYRELVEEYGTLDAAVDEMSKTDDFRELAGLIAADLAQYRAQTRTLQ